MSRTKKKCLVREENIKIVIFSYGELKVVYKIQEKSTGVDKIGGLNRVNSFLGAVKRLNLKFGGINFKVLKNNIEKLEP